MADDALPTAILLSLFPVSAKEETARRAFWQAKYKDLGTAPAPAELQLLSALDLNLQVGTGKVLPDDQARAALWDAVIGSDVLVTALASGEVFQLAKAVGESFAIVPPDGVATFMAWTPDAARLKTLANNLAQSGLDVATALGEEPSFTAGALADDAVAGEVPEEGVTEGASPAESAGLSMPAKIGIAAAFVLVAGSVIYAIERTAPEAPAAE